MLDEELTGVVPPSVLVNLQTGITGDFEDNVQQITDVGIV